jgi:4-alpha-glucanotransferase
MLDIFFNSRDEYNKIPFGACKCNQSIMFRLQVRCDAPIRAYINLDNVKLEMELEKIEWNLSSFIISVNAPAEPGLSYYYFTVSTPYHTVYLGNAKDGMQGTGIKYDKDPVPYQITVFDDYVTPDWMKGPVMYQIFPDRFYKEQLFLSPTWNRKYHDNWNDMPFTEEDFPNREMDCSDFFGGNLQGIIKKLDYLKELNVRVLYLNPIFKAYSNHRYDTADYMTIDDTLGTNEDFHELCVKAAEKDIYIILDGVFSHTGADSIYFNKSGTFNSNGAYQSTDSEYREWYKINNDGTYESWWGIKTLPDTDEMNASYQKYIFNVVQYWLDLGAKGFRLDVADELPDAFIRKLRNVLKRKDPDAVLIGEVWEDASNKKSYDMQREYLWGLELDSVMNYPYRNAILEFTRGFIDANKFIRKIEIIRENYPKPSYECLMNFLGTHDVPRLISILGDDDKYTGLLRDKQKNIRLSDGAYVRAKKKVKFAVKLLMTLPGAPCIYYGDEAGVEGLNDPMNRKTYPWGNEDQDLIEFFRECTYTRAQREELQIGSFEINTVDEHTISIRRTYGNTVTQVIFDRKACAFREDTKSV